MAQKEEYNVLAKHMGGGPHGLGDPDDKSLRKVEIEVLIPKKMREIAKVEKCVEEVKQFTHCCKNNNIMMVWNCRDQNTALKECLTKWYHDEAFKERCKREYLEERSAYRRTGIPTKLATTRLPTSM